MAACRSAVRPRRSAAAIRARSARTSGDPLREQLSGLSDKALIDRCAGLRPGAVSSPTASTKHALRTLAKRFQTLEAEIREHDAILDDLTRSHAPTLRGGTGIGADTVAEMLIVFGDNPERIHSEAGNPRQQPLPG